jgi:O-antigen ligase
LAGLIGAAGLLLTYDRTSYLGLAAACAALFVCAVRRGWILLVAAAGILALTAAIGSRGYRSNTPFHTSIPARVFSLFDPHDKNIRTRILVYKGSARVALRHPWVGVSEGGFKDAYDQVRDPQERESRRRDSFHAHNLFLQIAATRGILSDLLLAGIIAVCLGWLGRQAKLRGDPLAHGLVLVAIASLVGFLVASMGDVYKFENYMTLALQLGLAVAASRWGTPLTRAGQEGGASAGQAPGRV